MVLSKKRVFSKEGLELNCPKIIAGFGGGVPCVNGPMICCFKCPVKSLWQVVQEGILPTSAHYPDCSDTLKSCCLGNVRR